MDLDPENKIDREQVKAMVAEGRTVNAIHHVREVLGIGLSEAKAFVEEIMGRPVGQRLPPVGARITSMSFPPDGKVDFAYTLDEQVDPADHLYNVLANLGLCDEYEAEYAKHRNKAEPEIATGIALVRNVFNRIGRESDRYQIQAETATAERDRLQAILDAERGIKGLPGWVYGREDGGWYLPAGLGRGHAMAYARCTGFFEVYERVGAVTNTRRHTCMDALDGMERATEILRSMNLIP